MKRKLLFLSIFLVITPIFLTTQKTIENTFLPYKLKKVKLLGIESKKLALGHFKSPLKKLLEQKGFQVIDIPHFGIHRYTKALKLSDFKPEVIIYSPSPFEFSEKKIQSKHFAPFLNLYHLSKKRFSKIISLFKSIPNPIELTYNFYHYKPSHPKEFLQLKSILLKLYEIEAKYLNQVAISKNAKLIFMTQPLRYKMINSKACYRLKEKQNKIWKKVKTLSKRGQFKKALDLNTILLTKNKLHSSLNYMQGLLFKNTQKVSKAIDYFKKAHTYECSLENSLTLYHQMLRRLNQELKISLFDVEQLVNEKMIQNDRMSSQISARERRNISLYLDAFL